MKKPTCCSHSKNIVDQSDSCHESLESGGTKKIAPSPCCVAEKVSEGPSCCGSSPVKKRDYLFLCSFIGVVILYCLPVFSETLIQSYPKLAAMSESVRMMLNQMWWGVLIGAVFIGFLSHIPQAFVLSILGKGGTWSGLARATSAGVLLDLCSHGILMVGAKLYQRGASIGQVMAFLLASPWNSFSLTLILFALIGWKLTLVFILFSMVIGLMTGWVFDQLVQRQKLPANPNAFTLPEDFAFWPEAKKGLAKTQFNMTFFKSVIVSGIRDSKMVVRWLLFGLLLAAVLQALLNEQHFERYFGASILGLLGTIFLATVLEVCSEGSAPIAADIVNRANAPGNGFAFLMAGVSTDYTEIMILKDVTKSWRIALFLPLITVPQVFFISWLINIATR